MGSPWSVPAIAVSRVTFYQANVQQHVGLKLAVRLRLLSLRLSHSHYPARCVEPTDSGRLSARQL